jgi:hypothetical protein
MGDTAVIATSQEHNRTSVHVHVMSLLLPSSILPINVGDRVIEIAGQDVPFPLAGTSG